MIYHSPFIQCYLKNNFTETIKQPEAIFYYIVFVRELLNVKFKANWGQFYYSMPEFIAKEENCAFYDATPNVYISWSKKWAMYIKDNTTHQELSALLSQIISHLNSISDLATEIEIENLTTQIYPVIEQLICLDILAPVKYALEKEFFEFFELYGEVLAIGHKYPQETLDKFPEWLTKYHNSPRKPQKTYYQLFYYLCCWINTIKNKLLDSTLSNYANDIFWELAWSDEYISNTERENYIEQIRANYASLWYFILNEY